MYTYLICLEAYRLLLKCFPYYMLPRIKKANKYMSFTSTGKKKYKNNNNKKTFQEEPKEISNVLV